MRWHQHQYDLETPQAKSIMIRLVWFGRNSRLTISVNDLSWPLIHRIIQPPEGQLESWMIDLFLGCTSPLPDSKGCFSAKSKTCKTCNKLGKEAASLSLLCQRQPSTKPVAHLFKLVILTITINWSNLVSPLSTIIPIPMTIKSEYYYHITIKPGCASGQTHPRWKRRTALWAPCWMAQGLKMACFRLFVHMVYFRLFIYLDVLGFTCTILLSSTFIWMFWA